MGGYVVGVFEDGGACTFTATPTGGGVSATARTTGAVNVDSTTCGSTVVPQGLLASGSYAVTLMYENAEGIATSAPLMVEVG